MNLNHITVTIAPYGPIDVSTVRTVLALRDCGANLLIHDAQADVSLTRSCICHAAYEKLDKSTDYVFFLDHDIAAPPEAFLRLTEISERLTDHYQTLTSVSGIYINRHLPDKAIVAAWKLRDQDPINYGHPKASPDAVIIPALTGLGAFCMPVNAFMAHVEESERACFPDPDHTVARVCQTGLVTAEYLQRFIDHKKLVEAPKGCLYWNMEDFDFCCREFDHGRMVVAAPINFAHRGKIPGNRTLFPGYNPAEHEATIIGW